MELKILLRTLLRKWWIVLPVLLVTFTFTVVLTFTQAPTYSVTATFVVAPNASFGDVKNFVNGLDILSRRAEIATTYAEVASSRLIKQEAATELNLSPEQRKSLSVESRLVAGTNVLEITVEGNDPAVVRDFANTVGTKTMTYARDLYEAFDLKSLDQATLPASSIKPNKKLNLALGAVLGLVLAGGIAFLSEYLQTPVGNVTNFGILDSETGSYNKRYFRQRLGEEMIRARRNKYPLSLALMNIDQLDVTGNPFSPQARSELLRKVSVFLRQHLRDEDVMARLDGTVFAFLLLDTPEENAKATIDKLRTRISWTPFEMEKSGLKFNLVSTAGIASYQHNGTGQDEFLAEAQRALQQAEASGYGKVYSLSENGEHS